MCGCALVCVYAECRKDLAKLGVREHVSGTLESTNDCLFHRRHRSRWNPSCLCRSEGVELGSTQAAGRRNMRTAWRTSSTRLGQGRSHGPAGSAHPGVGW